MDGFIETVCWSSRVDCPFQCWRGKGLDTLMTLENFSVFRASHLFVAKKEIKYSKMRTAESYGI